VNYKTYCDYNYHQFSYNINYYNNQNFLTWMQFYFYWFWKSVNLLFLILILWMKFMYVVVSCLRRMLKKIFKINLINWLRWSNFWPKICILVFNMCEGRQRSDWRIKTYNIFLVLHNICWLAFKVFSAVLHTTITSCDAWHKLPRFFCCNS